MASWEQGKGMGRKTQGKYPYLLLLDPMTRMAAAYRSDRQLITPLASAKLVAFAEEHTRSRVAWSEVLYAGEVERGGRVRQLPDWATPEVRARCVMLGIEREGKSDAFYRSIPKK